MKYTVIYTYSNGSETFAPKPFDWHYDWINSFSNEELSTMTISAREQATSAEIQFVEDLKAIVRNRLNPKGN